MAADLHIHIYEGLTEEDMGVFFSNTLGSKYCFFPYFPNHTQERKDEVREKIYRTPDLWIGEVSWLKAALFDGDEDYIPDTVQKVHELIGEDLPVLDDKLIGDIVSAFDLENTTGYSLAKPEDVKAFLEEHKGKRAFTISW